MPIPDFSRLADALRPRLSPPEKKDKTDMKRIAILITSILLCLLGLPHISPAAEPVKEKITVKGIEREYYLYKPVKLSSVGRPLLFVLHGGTGSAEQMLYKFKSRELTQLAEKEGFLVVYPNGTPDEPGSKRHHWNDGRELTKWKAFDIKSDDLVFFEAMIDLFTKRDGVDPKRVYAVGISNGGMMSLRLALDLPKKFAAVCSIAANLPANFKDRKVATPVSILIMNGTEDKLMPYRGGYIIGRQDMGQVLSAPDTALFWAKANRCRPEPETALLADLQPEDGTKVTRFVYPNCLKGVEVVLYSIENGGHTWPNGDQYLPERVVGKVSRDLDANQTLWNFFKNKVIH
jgi:polyhydroxybutyrate depolymerase